MNDKTIASEVLTLDKLESMAPNSIIDSGIVKNSPDDIYMTDSNIGREMIWIAQRGHIHDWCIYIHWADNGFNFVLSNGDKVTSLENIRKLVPCDDEALKCYRF